jgi:transcriptional regulator with XRE-family HTH domain
MENQLEEEEAADPDLTWEEGSDLINKVGGERWLAKRIQDERRVRGMSQADLARAMAEYGYPVHQSAISKIEKPPRTGPRAISIDEAIGFSKVFGIPLGELLLPPDALSNIAAWRRYVGAEGTKLEIQGLTKLYEEDVAYLRDAARQLPGFRRQLEEHRAQMVRTAEELVKSLVPRLGRARAEQQVARVGYDTRIAVVDEVLAETEESPSGGVA